MEETFDKLKMLLDEIGRSDLKLNDENKFNIFPILRGPYEEVSLHSRFIFELLNPEGTHNEGDEFLNSFLEIVENRNLEILGPEKFKTAGIQNFNMDAVWVDKEHYNIDILITNDKDQAIIIENKLWAGDQNEQLKRYYDIIKGKRYKGIWLIYLTLDGKRPSKNSLGKLPEKVINESLITISYSDHILQWLEKCIEKNSRTPFLNETITQYKNLVEEITMDKGNIEKIYGLLTTDNIRSAYTFGRYWNDIKWHLEWNFWSDFEKIIQKEENIFQKKEGTILSKYTILDLQKYSYNPWKSGNGNPWYGIMFELFSKREDTFCLYIERGAGSVHYGITIVNNINNIIKRASKEKYDGYTEFADKLKEFTRWDKEDLPQQGGAWLGGKYFEKGINFNVPMPTFFALIDENHRKEYVTEKWAEIKEFIEQVKKIKAEVLDKST